MRGKTLVDELRRHERCILKLCRLQEDASDAHYCFGHVLAHQDVFDPCKMSKVLRESVMTNFSRNIGARHCTLHLMRQPLMEWALSWHKSDLRCKMFSEGSYLVSVAHSVRKREPMCFGRSSVHMTMLKMLAQNSLIRVAGIVPTCSPLIATPNGNVCALDLSIRGTLDDAMTPR